jgi:hypothetical protein
MKSLHSLAISSQSSSTAISLSSLLQQPSPEPDSVLIPLLPGSYPDRLTSRNSTNSNKSQSQRYVTTDGQPASLSWIFFAIFIAPLHERRRKHSLSIVEKLRLQGRCISTEVIRLLLAYSLPWEYVYRAVA